MLSIIIVIFTILLLMTLVYLHLDNIGNYYLDFFKIVLIIIVFYGEKTYKTFEVSLFTKKMKPKISTNFYYSGYKKQENMHFYIFSINVENNSSSIENFEVQLMSQQFHDKVVVKLEDWGNVQIPVKDIKPSTQIFKEGDVIPSLERGTTISLKAKHIGSGGSLRGTVGILNEHLLDQNGNILLHYVLNKYAHLSYQWYADNKPFTEKATLSLHEGSLKKIEEFFK